MIMGELSTTRGSFAVPSVKGIIRAIAHINLLAFASESAWRADRSPDLEKSHLRTDRVPRWTP